MADISLPLQERDNLYGKDKSRSESTKVTAATEALIQDISCPPITLEWKNITFTVKSKTAGKTTLLNILAGHLHKGYEGEVHVNGYLRGVELFNMQSCYVMQDDCLLQELTVREAIAMSLELRTSTTRGENISHLVTEVMDQWGLEECADTLTRSLSGGERKRLAISQELISNSPVILDRRAYQWP
ncbi:hypothetical protein MTO96_007322 [Rhipicephalus appendiculatus]